jgi:hypothetical protein
MLERWKDIEGYDGEYQISNLGHVRSRKSNMNLRPMAATNGYLVACLWHEGKQRKICIHRLVAQAFIPNPNSLSDVNHIDEDKTNNCAINLHWCSHKFNMNYGHVKEKIGLKNKGRKTTEETKLKLSQISKNSCWITNGKKEKFILVSNRISFLENGWEQGRLQRRVTNYV